MSPELIDSLSEQTVRYRSILDAQAWVAYLNAHLDGVVNAPVFTTDDLVPATVSVFNRFPYENNMSLGLDLSETLPDMLLVQICEPFFPPLTNFSAVATLKGILVSWDVIIKHPEHFAVELWVSDTNDRDTATLLQTCMANYYLHTGLPANSTRYYWVRTRSIYQDTGGTAYGPWEPASSTAGVSATTLLAQTEDINPNAATAISLAQSSAAATQTAYSTWETLFRYTFAGTGNYFIIDAQHISNLALSAIGTTGSAGAFQAMELVEHTVYEAGTVSVTNGSPVVSGSGTTWLTSLAAGNIFLAPNGVRYVILSVNSNTQLTLTVNYPGTTLAEQEYYVITASASAISLTLQVAEYAISGTYCLSSKQPLKYRLPFPSINGKLYDCNLHWLLQRTDASWSISQSSVLKTIILEEIKR